MTHGQPTPVEPYDGDDETSGAVGYPRAARAARQLAGLPPPPQTPPRPPSHTSPEPLRGGRVGLVLAVLTGGGLAWWLVTQLLP